MNLSIEVTKNDTTSTIVVNGEVDVSNAGELRSAVEQANETAPSRLEVNLANVAYIDSTGIGVLVGAAHAAAEANRAFAVIKPQPNVKRVLGLLGVESELNVED